MQMRYYTLGETAALLGDSPDNVFEMTTGCTEPVLWPAAFFDLAVKVNRHISNKNNDPDGANSYGWGIGHTTVKEEVRGCFSVTSFEGSPFLKWNKSNRAKVGILTHDNLKYFVLDDRFISKIDLRISSISLASYMDAEGIPVPEHLHTELLKQNKNETLDSPSSQKKGGRNQSPLSEAIEYVYKKYRNEGNTEILRSGKM